MDKALFWIVLLPWLLAFWLLVQMAGWQARARRQRGKAERLAALVRAMGLDPEAVSMADARAVKDRLETLPLHGWHPEEEEGP